MDLTSASHELMRRESDRECRKNFGFGLDEIPPMSQWEMKIRQAAIEASRSASYQKGRPTQRQRQKIEEYNQVARRYCTLADAEFQIRQGEIEEAVARERAAGTYWEPGIAEGARAGAIALWIVCLIVLLVIVRLCGSTSPWIDLGAVTIATAILPLMWNCPAADPRLIDAMRKRRNMRVFWKTVR